ncbi:hypothetical protein EU642_21805 [Salmonella enterica]|nr:hypothetical protein [Salmonella enterica]EAO0118489.1 hypothetical protein [Salmonella enterica]EAO3601709.1 hypothetical protein [Salmonella enterica]EAR6391606.1 hypothetical protein [Salmonella enterica]EAV1285251.1 hypothetical protein [Salmonella enterica]
MSAIALMREYAIGMVGTGVLAAVVDHYLFYSGAITRKLTLRGCFLMGLLWPLFILLLVTLICPFRKRKE